MAYYWVASVGNYNALVRAASEEGAVRKAKKDFERRYGQDPEEMGFEAYTLSEFFEDEDGGVIPITTYDVVEELASKICP